MNRFARNMKLVTMSAFVPIALTFFTASSARAGAVNSDGIIVIPVFTYSVVNTPFPNWALGDPQSALVGVCSVLVGNCGNVGAGPLENEAAIALLTAPATFGGYTVNGDSFAQEAAFQIGADVRVPTAWWVTPTVYVWAGGGVAFFNSIVGGVAFANELVVLDPAPDPYTWLQNFSVDLGDPITLPAANTNLSPDMNGNVDVPSPSFSEVPEPASIVLLGLGAGLLWTRRRAKV